MSPRFSPANPKRWISIVTTLYLLICFAGCFWMGAMLRSGELTHLLMIPLLPIKTYVYCALSGAIGGTLYALRLVHQYYEQLDERWMWWYMLRPIQCAGAAVMTIVLFQSGILLLQTGDSLYAKVGTSFLVGFGYGKLMDKIKSLTETLFNGSSSKKQPPDGKPPQE
ncbi:hypothetical protein [Paenibacillus puerhi]|uniref:hypothetical protein n=1 Tax=Paenibacillus puerhi TaxID=2692622 RepID=UPI00135B5CE5|nr:hypothetical protein [Paenibacillus puerhi]